LYDKTMTYLLGWLRPDNSGEFEFGNLPFGDYVLIGEKAGYRKSETPVINLSADSPVISGVTVKILPYKISIAIPDEAITGVEGIAVSPNPTHDVVKISGLTEKCEYEILLSDAFGRKVNADEIATRMDSGVLEISLASLPSGLFIIVLRSAGNPVLYFKLIKQ